MHFLMYRGCTARFQSCRNSISVTTRCPVFGTCQFMYFLLVTLFPNKIKEAACLTGKGITLHFKACRNDVRGIELCQTSQTLLKAKNTVWDTLVTL